ncbi:hypothetical protein [Micromonospora sp. KC723]|uniref:hypothetical protein n=1 Tax=Micromonospora sp. KC723 TaxID=2530381 RepID=UPI001049D6A6|nr:hypothetical protein [Micromonospora sp. KC723]TDB70025.1 hypothetical protein E1165_26920 [Micromonospora sp. KC723]
MNDVDRLRRAMRATERADRTSLDLTLVMREGRRLRRRRRLAGAGVAAVVVAAVAVVGVTVGVRPGPPELPSPAGPAVTAPAVRPTTPVAAPPQQEGQPVGDVVDSGIWYGGDQRVFYFVPVKLPSQPGVRIGLVAGRRTAGGKLTSDHLINDVEGNDRRPGFHQIGYDQSGGRPSLTSLPAFGYFVGPAERIVGTVDGRQVTARQARWSEDPEVVIFWFDPEQLAPGVELDGIIARDAGGRTL